MRQLTFSAPDQLQSRLKGLPIAAFVAAAQGLRPTRSPDAVTAATKARCPRWPTVSPTSKPRSASSTP